MLDTIVPDSDAVHARGSRSGLKIANVMFSRGRGGIEQAFLDYNVALSSSGFSAEPIISRGAQIEQKLRDDGFRYSSISQLGWWDFMAARRLSRLCEHMRASAIITHGNRALSLAGAAAMPVIAVVHNYNSASLESASAVIATTTDLAEHAARMGCKTEPFVIPNVVLVTRPPPPDRFRFREPPVIGAMGRMVEKKGFELLCDALAILRSQGTPFSAIIAGDGERRQHLTRKVRDLALDDCVQLVGWIDGASMKNAFWESIDIFCLPSHHEPFGISLLEAWAAGKPVITTETEGPRVIADESNAIFVAKGDPIALAKAIHSLTLAPEKAHQLAVNGYNTACARCHPQVLADGLSTVIRRIVPDSSLAGGGPRREN